MQPYEYPTHESGANRVWRAVKVVVFLIGFATLMFSARHLYYDHKNLDAMISAVIQNQQQKLLQQQQGAQK